jgi:hypothetical protein
MSKEALCIALEALEYWDVHGKLHQPTEEAIDAIKKALAAPAQEIVCSTGLCHYKPAAQPAQKRHVSYVCPQCHWSLEKQPAPVQEPVGVCGNPRNACGLPCEPCEGKPDPEWITPPAAPVQEPVGYVKLIDTPFGKKLKPVLTVAVTVGSKLYTTPPSAQPAPDLQAELDATSRQVEILSDALAESRREVAALTAVQEPVAFLVDGDLYYPEEIDWESLQKQGHTVASLYTIPPAAQQEQQK